MQAMGNSDSGLVIVPCSTCNGGGVTGKDSKGNNIICSSCHGSGKSVTLKRRG